MISLFEPERNVTWQPYLEVEVENSLTAATTLDLLFTELSRSFKHFIAFKRLLDAIACCNLREMWACPATWSWSEKSGQRKGSILSLRQQGGFWNVPRSVAWPQGIWRTVGYGWERNLVHSPRLYVLFLATSAGGCLGSVTDVQWSDQPLGGVRRPRNARRTTHWPWPLQPCSCPWKHQGIFLPSYGFTVQSALCESWQRIVYFMFGLSVVCVL